MRSEHASDADVPGEDAVATDVGDGSDRVLATVFGYDVVLEQEFVEFPWRAGFRRGSIAVAATFVLVLLVAAASGLSGGSVAGTLAYVGIVVYGLHQIPVTRGTVPDVLQPLADHVLGIPALRGFVLAGPNHGDPVGHVVDVAGGKAASIGHVNPVPAETTVPVEVYYAIPVVVLVAVGYEFALRYWAHSTVDSVVEVGRFGAAVAGGYLLVLFAGTFVVTTAGAAGVFGQQSVVVLPDRYVTVVFGSVYPAVFASLGAFVVYAQKEWL